MVRARTKQVSASQESTSVKRGPSSASSTPLRQSKRIKAEPAASSTRENGSKKTKYTEPESDESEAFSASQKDDSGYEDDAAEVVSSAVVSDAEPTEDDDDDDEPVSEDERPRKRKSGAKASDPSTKAKAAAEQAKGKELWRVGVKADLAPGEEVFIKLPKARQPGKTAYTPATLHPNTFLFLGDLKDNNERAWLKIHDADYRQAQKDFDSFIQTLTEKLIEKDETIPELPPKDLTFRIYRDVRFSSDPTPYKTHFSAAWSRTGRKGPYAHYYLQVSPGQSFVGGGIWHPESAPLALLRSNVDRRSHKLKEVLLDSSIRKEFLKNAPKDEKKVVKAFVDTNSENALKTRPKGFEADNPNLDLLRLRNYTMGRKLQDDEVVGPGGADKVANLMGAMTPFITYLNSIVMPDNDEDDGGDDDDEEEDEEEEE